MYIAKVTPQSLFTMNKANRESEEILNPQHDTFTWIKEKSKYTGKDVYRGITAKGRVDYCQGIPQPVADRIGFPILAPDDGWAQKSAYSQETDMTDHYDFQ